MGIWRREEMIRQAMTAIASSAVFLVVFLAVLQPLALAYDSPAWGSCKSGGGDWSRPGGDVQNTATGVSDCAGKCTGYTYFGFECPRADTVHCQCANNLGNKESDATKCKSNSGVASSHCAGPYEHGSVMMGGHGFGSVYKVPTPTPTPQHGWTKWKGTAAPGTECSQACQTGTPPTADPLGYTVTSWCNTTDNLWGECGGCAPGKYKPTGSNVCSGTCSSDGESRDDGPPVHCATCIDGMVTGFSGSNPRSCTSCKLSTSYPSLMRSTTEPVFSCQTHTHGDVQLSTKCYPPSFGSTSGGSYNCVKAGRRKFRRMHKDFWNKKSAEGYHNWWAVECGLEKTVRCAVTTTNGKAKTTCFVKKRAQCIKVCKGTTIWGNSAQVPTHVNDALASTVAGNCYAGCVDNTRTDKKIKAVPGFVPADPAGLSRSEGPLENPSDWCVEEAIGL